MKKLLNLATLFVFLGIIGCLSDENKTLKGEFSVSENKKVNFSKGNLQYNIAAKTYKFADNQWDVVDNSQEICDVFAWGSGKNPIQLTDTFVDWGTNPIVNGGDKTNQWRTLSSDEWEFLILKRKNCKQLISFATINNVKGVVILPDNWQQPQDITFNTISTNLFANAKNMLMINHYDSTDYTTKNIYTTSQWSEMENLGAMFLPFNINQNKPHPRGQYWTTDSNFVSIEPKNIWPKRGCKIQALKMSVRLAKNIE